jgi:hypothetical protein
LRKLSGFKYATAIDLRMGYYHIPLDLEAQKLCTTILPWGKYCRDIPLGISKSSNGIDDVWAMVETMVSAKAKDYDVNVT